MKYPAASFIPSAVPLRSGPARSSFMFTVMDQASPWFSPSSTFAPITQPQVGANMRTSGTGAPSSQPAIRTRRRPSRSDSRPANRLASAFARPNVATNDTAAVADRTPISSRASSGTTERSRPTMPPTKALTATSSANWRQLAPRPRDIARAAAGPAVARPSPCVTKLYALTPAGGQLPEQDAVNSGRDAEVRDADQCADRRQHAAKGVPGLRGSRREGCAGRGAPDGSHSAGEAPRRAVFRERRRAGKPPEAEVVYIVERVAALQCPGQGERNDRPEYPLR